MRQRGKLAVCVAPRQAAVVHLVDAGAALSMLDAIAAFPTHDPISMTCANLLESLVELLLPGDVYS